MCGIIGYVGDKDAVPVLVEGLRRLAYRGYDSAGIAVIKDGEVHIRRRPGKLPELFRALKDEPLDGHTGLGHCLAPETLIQLADGRVLPISTLDGEVEVLSLDRETLQFAARPAFVFRHRSPETLIQLRTSSSSISCTREHRLFLMDQETGELVEKLAGEIQPGDLLLLAKGIPAPTTAKEIIFAPVQPRRYRALDGAAAESLRDAVTASGLTRVELAARIGMSESALRHILGNDRNAREDWLAGICHELALPFPPMPSTPVHSRHGNFVRLPERATTELMQLAGYFIGDGHAHERCLRWKDQRREVLERYQRIIFAIFGLEGRIVPLPGVNAWLLEVNSIELARWFRKQFVEGREELFAELGRQSNEMLSAFLRGLFDAEGYIAKAARQVALCMNDIELVRRVQQWMLRFGIISSLHLAPPSPQHRRINTSAGIFINSAQAVLAFASTIGFSASDKQEALASLLKVKSPVRCRSVKPIPLRTSSFRRQLREMGIGASIERQLNSGPHLSESGAQRVIEALAGHSGAEPIRAPLQRFLDSDVVFQEVLSVREIPSPSPWVYDLEVPVNECFFANGILSHNSRWATHGRPTEENAHPHRDCSGRIVVVHNGIIENYLQLKRELQAEGHEFLTETDTEVIAHLIERELREHPDEDFDSAFRRTLARLRGIYALVAFSADEPQRLVTARLGPPIVIGIGKGEYFVASDIPAILPHTREMIFLGDGETALIDRSGVRLRDSSGEPIERPAQHVSWDPIQAEKGGYKHFMLKEIYEQPRALRDTSRGRISLDSGRVFLDEVAIPAEEFRSFTDLKIAACGTAWHAALVTKYLIEELARIPVEVDYASEFRYRNPIVSERTLMLVISQSGETADTLAALREAKARGARTLAICNVPGAIMTREADGTIYTHAGPEIGVASTKAFTSQLVAAYLLALYLGQGRGLLSEEQLRAHAVQLSALPVRMESMLEKQGPYEELAKEFFRATDFLYLGRGINFPIALEGALKLKEISYIHAEGYAAGEMKHGPNALIDEKLPVVVINTLDEESESSRLRYEKTLSNIQEVKARDGRVIAVVTEGDVETAEMADYTIEVPQASELLAPVLSVVPLQLLAYKIGVWRGCDVDQPRNLAKSVTVE